MMKSKLFKHKYSSISIEVLENGWITICEDGRKTMISLGAPENLRIELLEKAIAYSRKLKQKEAEINQNE